MTQGLSVEFEAVVDGDSYLPGVGGTDEPAEVATAPPMPDETAVAESGQPEEEDESSDPNHEIHMKAKEQVMSNLEDLADGIVKIGDRVLTLCVACGDPRHTLSEGEFDTGRIAEVNRGIEIMRQALCRYPKHQPRLRGADATSDAPIQHADDGVPMETETGSAASPTTRRPRAKARPRRATIIADVILIRYDNPRDLGSDVTSRRGQFLMWGVDIAETGPVSQDRVCQMIEDASDHTHRCLPQRGDRPKYAINADTGDHDNKGYACVSDNVTGGILDLLPIEGARFIHSRWNLVDTCRPRNMTRVL